MLLYNNTLYYYILNDADKFTKIIFLLLNLLYYWKKNIILINSFISFNILLIICF